MATSAENEPAPEGGGSWEAEDLPVDQQQGVSSSLQTTPKKSKPRITSPRLSHGRRRSPYRHRQTRAAGGGGGGGSPSLNASSGIGGTSVVSGPGAVDEAPPIQFLPGKNKAPPGKQRHQTPQFIASLHPDTKNDHGVEEGTSAEDEENRNLLELSPQTLAPIQIVSCYNDNTKQYLLQPLRKGRLAIWSMSSMLDAWKECENHDEEVLSNVLTSPELTVDARLVAGLVDWVQLSDDLVSTLLLWNKNEGPSIFLLGLCTNGLLVLLSIRVSEDPTCRGHQILTTWNMGRGGVTCFNVTQSGLVLVGDHCGRLHASQLIKPFRPPSAASPKISAKSTTATTDVHAVPAWQGSFGHGHAIRSIAELTYNNPRPKIEKPRRSADACVVAVTVQSKNRVATAMQLEVIDVGAILRHIRDGQDTKKDQTNTDAPPPPPNVPLEEYWVLPEPGGELTDAPVLREHGQGTTSSSIRTVRWIPSRGTHRLCRIAVDRVALALADGTGAILTLQQNENGTPLLWGIDSREQHQWLFSYPCIGMGRIEVHGKPHLACALRGGTVYLVPIGSSSTTTGGGGAAPNNNNNNKDCVKVVTYPHDVDSDCPMQQLQSFSAADIIRAPAWTDGTNDDDRSMMPPPPRSGVPLLFFSWPGGIVDVYACHLLRPRELPPGNREQQLREQQRALAELVNNGAAEDLRGLLKSSKLKSGDGAGTFQRQRDSWAKAAREVATTDAALTLNEMKAESGLKHFRSLLLQLATPSGDWERALSGMFESLEE